MVSTGERLEGESNDFQLQISSPAIIPLSKKPLTWGVELEFVFAFHETQLDLNPFTNFRTVPAITHPTVTDKKLAYWFRRSVVEFKNIIPWHRLPHRVYNSWGLHNEGKVPKRQPYSKEVHYILERLLKEKCPSIDTRVEESKPIDEKDNGMYEDNQWLILHDYSVCGVGSKNIPTWLPRVVAAKAADWDSYGVELVSPIFNTGSNQGYNEIALILGGIERESVRPDRGFHHESMRTPRPRRCPEKPQSSQRTSSPHCRIRIRDIQTSPTLPSSRAPQCSIRR